MSQQIEIAPGVYINQTGPDGQFSQVAREHMQRVSEMKRDPALEAGVAPQMGQYAIPHMAGFQSMVGSYSKTYLPSDEALQNSAENARIMRNDVGILECIISRQRSVALLPWHIEPEDEHSEDQKVLADLLTKMVKRIRRFTEYRRNCQEAIWYGRSGIQNRYGKVQIGNRWYTLPKPKTRNDPGWKPINGDKLVWRFDDGNNLNADQLGIRIALNDIKTAQSRGWNIEPTHYGWAYFVPDYVRDTMVIHKHMLEDGDYRDVHSAGALHGKGIRSMIYWEWYQKQELLAFMMEYLERAAGGIEIVEYPMGDTNALAEIKQAMADRLSGQRNTLFFPKRAGSEQLYNVIPIEPGFQGVQMVQELLVKYFGHRMKRLILGQTLSSEADGAGLGSSGISDLHHDTLMQIIQYDADNLGDTLTWDLLRPIIDYNFPQAAGIDFRFVIDVEHQDAEQSLASMSMAYQMGAEIPEADVMDVLGLNPAEPGERVLSLQQQQEQQMAMGQMFPGAPDPGLSGPPRDGDGDNIPGEDRFDIPELPSQQDNGEEYAGQSAGLPNDDKSRVYSREGEPVRYQLSSLADSAALVTVTPTEAQAKSGNYRKGRFRWHNFEVVIETPKGKTRGKYKTPLKAHYGYIRRTMGADGDQVDVFIGPNINSQLVVVIDQTDGNGGFEEHKCLIGFDDERAAVTAYQRSYSPGWEIGKTRSMTVGNFLKWLKTGDQNIPIDRYARKPEPDRYRLHSFRGPDGVAYGYDDRSNTIVDPQQVETLHGFANTPAMTGQPSEWQQAIMDVAQNEGPGQIDNENASRLRDLKMAESPFSSPQSNSERFHEAEKGPRGRKKGRFADKSENANLRRQLEDVTSKLDAATKAKLMNQFDSPEPGPSGGGSGCGAGKEGSPGFEQGNDCGSNEKGLSQSAPNSQGNTGDSGSNEIANEIDLGGQNPSAEERINQFIDGRQPKPGGRRAEGRFADDAGGGEMNHLDQSISDVAAHYDVDPDELDSVSAELHRQALEQWAHEQQALSTARAATGQNSRTIRQHENAGRDMDSVSRFDEAAAGAYGESSDMASLGLHTAQDSSEAGERLWNMLGEGARPKPTQHDPAILQQAAEYILANGGGDFSTRGVDEEDESTSFDFGANVEPFSRRGEPDRYMALVAQG